MASVSVIMPAYNATPTIKRAIDSALSQTFGEVEVIVVDDCSRDGTPEYVRSTYAGDSRVRVLVQPSNGGPSRARNAAIAASSADWVALLDADDAWLPDRLEVLLKSADADLIADNLLAYDAEADLITGPFFHTAEDGEIDLVRLLRTAVGFDFGYLKPLMRRSFLATHAIAYSETLRHGEDLVMYTRCLCEGARFQVLNYAGYVYTMPFGKVSRTASAHSHTRHDPDALREALLAMKQEFAATLTPRQRAAFDWRTEFYRTRKAFDQFMAGYRGRDVRAMLAAFASDPRHVGAHASRLLWVRLVS